MTISSTIADGVQRTFSVPAYTGTPVVKVNGTVVTWTAQGNNNLVLNSVPAKDAVVTIEYTEQTFNKPSFTTAQQANTNIKGAAGADISGGIYDAAGNKISYANAQKDANGNVTAILNDDGSEASIGGGGGTSISLVSSRPTVIADSGAESIYNATSSSYTLTVAANTITKPTTVQQESTGTITLEAGAGVTFVGISYATSGVGSMLAIIPTSTPNKYIIVKGGL